MSAPDLRHEPVLPATTLAALAPRPGAVLLDGTHGMGGHAALWLEASAPTGRVVALDRDRSALERAAERLAAYGERVERHHLRFEEAPEAFAGRRFDAVLLDLGLGSHQLDDPERGFAFSKEGPLDMRMDRDTPAPDAAELLAQAPEPELARIFAEYGEERAARKLARVLVSERGRRRIATTAELAELVRATVRAPRGAKVDPATRAFQALRIAVNEELSGLDEAIEGLARLLAPGGRIAIIAFHSLEDRIAKRTLRRLAEPCRCRRGDPCTCGALELLELPQRKPLVADDEEKAENPRARSARLRYGVRR